MGVCYRIGGREVIFNATLNIQANPGQSVSVTGDWTYSGTTNSNGTITFTIKKAGTYTVTCQGVSQTVNVTTNGGVYSANVMKPYKLTISQGANSTITVNRTASPKKGASTGILTNNADIYHGDNLKITFGAATYYQIDKHTVNDVTFASGSNRTVNGNVAVASTAKRQTWVIYVYITTSDDDFTSRPDRTSRFEIPAGYTWGELQTAERAATNNPFYRPESAHPETPYNAFVGYTRTSGTNNFVTVRSTAGVYRGAGNVRANSWSGGTPQTAEDMPVNNATYYANFTLL